MPEPEDKTNITSSEIEHSPEEEGILKSTMDSNTTETGVGSNWEDRDITDKSISSKNNEKHNANKDVIIKLIVPEIRMHLPSYLIGSIALVTSSLSNSGRLF